MFKIWCSQLSGHGGLLEPDWGNTFKQGKKEYNETVYPVDHNCAGQIHDFFLFNHFVKPMPAGVRVTCVIDCCHSGSVLDLPYKFKPAPAETIQMQRNMDANLAFLYILVGGMLPFDGLFQGTGDAIENSTRGALDSFQGVGLDEMTNDNIDRNWYPEPSENIGRDLVDTISDSGKICNLDGEAAGGKYFGTVDYGYNFVDNRYAANDLDARDADGGLVGCLHGVGTDYDNLDDLVDCSCVADFMGALLEDN